jgi:hypothetical protein
LAFPFRALHARPAVEFCRPISNTERRRRVPGGSTGAIGLKRACARMPDGCSRPIDKSTYLAGHARCPSVQIVVHHPGLARCAAFKRLLGTGRTGLALARMACLSLSPGRAVCAFSEWVFVMVSQTSQALYADFYRPYQPSVVVEGCPVWALRAEPKLCCNTGVAALRTAHTRCDRSIVVVSRTRLACLTHRFCDTHARQVLATCTGRAFVGLCLSKPANRTVLTSTGSDRRKFSRRTNRTRSGSRCGEGTSGAEPAAVVVYELSRFAKRWCDASRAVSCRDLRGGALPARPRCRISVGSSWAPRQASRAAR